MKFTISSKRTNYYGSHFFNSSIPIPIPQSSFPPSGAGQTKKTLSQSTKEVEKTLPRPYSCIVFNGRVQLHFCFSDSVCRFHISLSWSNVMIKWGVHIGNGEEAQLEIERWHRVKGHDIIETKKNSTFCNNSRRLAVPANVALTCKENSQMSTVGVSEEHSCIQISSNTFESSSCNCLFFSNSLSYCILHSADSSIASRFACSNCLLVVDAEKSTYKETY